MKSAFILIAGLLIGMAVFAGFYFFANNNLNTALPTPMPTQAANKEAAEGMPTDTPSNTSETGTIEGSIIFPSEVIPKDLEVCAETVTGKTVKCTTEHIEDGRFTYRVGYTLELPEGEYFVYSKTPDSDYKAYYTEFVTCGLLATCPSHEKLEVSVLPGETATEVDPGDWYNITE